MVATPTFDTRSLGRYDFRRNYQLRLLSKDTTMSHLFEPLTLRSITLPNRIGVRPVCQ